MTAERRIELLWEAALALVAGVVGSILAPLILPNQTKNLWCADKKDLLFATKTIQAPPETIIELIRHRLTDYNKWGCDALSTSETDQLLATGEAKKNSTDGSYSYSYDTVAPDKSNTTWKKSEQGNTIPPYSSTYTPSYSSTYTPSYGTTDIAPVPGPRPVYNPKSDTWTYIGSVRKADSATPSYSPDTSTYYSPDTVVVAVAKIGDTGWVSLGRIDQRQQDSNFTNAEAYLTGRAMEADPKMILKAKQDIPLRAAAIDPGSGVQQNPTLAVVRKAQCASASALTATSIRLWAKVTIVECSSS